MLELTVGNGRDFLTITEALQAIPYDTSATIRIDAGIYEEKVFCEKRDITLIGAGPDETIIRWADYGYKPHPDGRKYGTFRSYTAFFGGERLTVKALAIENTSGDHKVAGQAIAAYVDSKMARFSNVHFRSQQDTLFCAPLPAVEREVGGFFGPRNFSDRRASTQIYQACNIAGNIDFIFGGADALFLDCTIVSTGAGYVAAPSDAQAGTGFIFKECRFTKTATCEQGTVYLARPWREEGKVAVINCDLDDHIHAAGFAAWNPADSWETNNRSTFVELESTGSGASPETRVSWAKKLDDEQLKSFNEQLKVLEKLADSL